MMKTLIMAIKVKDDQNCDFMFIYVCNLKY